MKILLIDDSPAMRCVQRNILEAMGHHAIAEADNGFDGLMQAIDAPPDLICLDWDMPTMDGLTFIHAYRRRNWSSRILMVAPHNQRNQVMQAIRAGADGYLLIPFTRRTFVNGIRRFSRLGAPTAGDF